MRRDQGKRAPRQVTLRVLSGLAVLLLLGGCGGGGDEDGDSPLPCIDLGFQMAITTITDGDVFLRGGVATCSTVEVAVMVRGLTGIWTVGFDLAYPTSLIEYESHALGSLLLKGNPVNSPVVLVNQSASGLQITLSRLPPDLAVSAVGTEELVIFRFRKVGSGAAIIDFDASPTSPVSETILDASGNPRPASFGPGHGGLVTIP